MSDLRDNNPYVSFYGKHAISPVRQDLSNFNIHLKRRANLYRTLGIPTAFFHDRRILEVGPGGGYNALTLFAWGAEADFVEPNPTAQQELGELFGKYQVAPERWTLFPGLIEEFATKNLYDLVLAEGFIPGLFTRDKVIAKLKTLVQSGGVVVVTCFDEISCFFEILKRLAAYYLTRNEQDFDTKVKMLTAAFASHLKALRYVSRPIEDWVKDMLMNPAVHGQLFSIADCLLEFGADFEFLGSSPAMFTNYQWYKDVDFDLHSNVMQQFQIKKHNLLLWDIPETINTIEQNQALSEITNKIRDLAGAVERNNDFNRSGMDEIINYLKQFIEIAANIDGRISKAIHEVIALLSDERLTPEKVATSENLACCFGRGQQYVSLVKR